MTRKACEIANNPQQDRTDGLEDSEAPRWPRPSLLRTGQARSPQVSHRLEAPWATGVTEQEALLFRLLRTLADVIISCAPHWPTPQCVCAHRERCSQVRAPTGWEASRAHGHSQEPGDGGDRDTANPWEGDRAHLSTKAQDDQGLLTLHPPPGQRPGQRDVGPGARPGSAT